MRIMKIVFMGTPEFSVPVLEKLIKEYEVILVVTQEDKKIGRHQEVKYSPIKEVALKNNIPVFQPAKIRTDYTKIIELNPDIIITCAYGQIIPKEILDCPKYGCINVHASLLPHLRGGAPIHRAIINGDETTGITIMYMAEGMDTGDIIMSKEIPILENDNVGTLHDKLALLGADLLIKTLPKIIDGTAFSLKQDEELATYGYNIKREDELLDFNDTNKNIFNKVRGLNPWPLAYIILNDSETKVIECEKSTDESSKKPGEITRILKDKIGVKTLDGEILITKIKPNGKKIMRVKDYLNGLKDKNIKINKE